MLPSFILDNSALTLCSCLLVLPLGTWRCGPTHYHMPVIHHMEVLFNQVIPLWFRASVGPLPFGAIGHLHPSAQSLCEHGHYLPGVLDLEDLITQAEAEIELNPQYEYLPNQIF